MLCSIKLEKLFGNFWFALLLLVRRAQYVWRVFGSVRHSPGLDVLWRHHLGISSDRERLLCAWLCFRFLSSLGSEKIRVDWSKLAYTRFLSLSQQNSLSTRPRATLSRPFFRCSGKLRNGKFRKFSDIWMKKMISKLINFQCKNVTTYCP